jgi:GntR family transcriptional regulator, transcriptional repressor for pyruvate dehydrogenase complex
MALKPKAVLTSHAYEQVADEIESQILEGRLQPGERLPGEVEMASLFGVNRSTVREGIRRLESDGLVRRASPRRLVVSVPRTRDLATRSSRALRMLEVTFDELWTTAHVTETLAAELAARNADEQDLARLDENQRRMERAVEEGGDQVKLDLAFHAAVAEASKNRALVLAREPIGLLLYSGLEALLPHLPQAPGRQLRAHAETIAAIRDRDPERARVWALRHIDDFRRGYELAGLPTDAPIAPLAPKTD